MAQKSTTKNSTSDQSPADGHQGNIGCNDLNFQKPAQDLSGTADTNDLSSSSATGSSSGTRHTESRSSSFVGTENHNSPDNHNSMDDLTNNSHFSAPPSSRHQQTNLLMRSETIMIHDSTPKHVQFKRYMGSLHAFSQRASTSSKALDVIRSFPQNTKMKYATLHEGVNDITDKVSTDIIISNLTSCLTELNEKFPNACIAFSEILFIGRGSRDSVENMAVSKVNAELQDFCKENNFVYVPHNSLQSTSCTLFDEHDDKHINSTGGTAVLVADIYYATGFKQSRSQRTGSGTNPTMFFNSSRNVQREMRPPQQLNGKADINQQHGLNVNHILEMMCMNQRAIMSFLKP